MRLALAALSALVLPALLLGCGNQEAVDAAVNMSDAVCACKQFTCAQEMAKKHNARIEEFKDARGTEDDKTKILAAGKRAQACITALRDSAKSP